MAESVTHSEKNSNELSVETPKEIEGNVAPDRTSFNPAAPVFQSPVIWTPRFIVIFALVLVLGLSITSILTQVLLHGYTKEEYVYLLYAIPLLGCWIAVLAYARSPWIRLGAIFGSIWTLLKIAEFVLGVFFIDSHFRSVTHLYAATDSAFLGISLCLSIARPPLSRWDGWFFLLAPIALVGLVINGYLQLPPDVGALANLEDALSTRILILCVLIWWMRPSCWKRQPGPSLLFGVVSIILFVQSVPNLATLDTWFISKQFILLFLLLAVMRILQCELQYRQLQNSDMSTQHRLDNQKRRDAIVEQVQQEAGPD